MVTRLSLLFCLLAALLSAASVPFAAQAQDKQRAVTEVTDDNRVQIISSNAATQVVQHLEGQSEVRLRPARIVTLHNSYTEALIALGIVPVGAVERPQGAAAQLKNALHATPSVGDQSSPDYEAILALQPDLILSVGEVHGQNYELLSAIAPTIVLREPEKDWRGWLKALAIVLDRETQADTHIAAYEQRVAKLRQIFQAQHSDETVLLLRVRQKDIRIYGAGRRSGPVLYEQLALTPHRLVPLNKNYEAISNELIGQMDANRIFLMVEDAGRLGSIEKSQLWKSLPAVQSGHVYKVNIEPWNQSSGPLSSGIIIDDIASAFGIRE